MIGVVCSRTLLGAPWPVLFGTARSGAYRVKEVLHHGPKDLFELLSLGVRGPGR